MLRARRSYRSHTQKKTHPTATRSSSSKTDGWRTIEAVFYEDFGEFHGAGPDRRRSAGCARSATAAPQKRRLSNRDGHFAAAPTERTRSSRLRRSNDRLELHSRHHIGPG